MRRRNVPVKGLFMGILLIAAVLMLVRCVFVSSDQQAVAVVNEFYQYEQQGDFASSWALFHSEMKKRFGKGAYIQDRAHVFMNHFGVETFTYTLDGAEKLDKWEMSKEGPAFKNVYKILVTQTYKGKYGYFELKQDVFAVKEKEKWCILWDYNGQ
ncbi:hypothetical protein ACFPA1_12675 [Neobacillus sp. GCM10023253]|uniref:hypothetical protein n=1 Tax=Neobacillus sp. GCM10023253 TaxID=3252644 RepID=UPI00360EDBF0